MADYRIAEEIGISRAMLSSWKLGKYTPKIDKLQKIADYFGVSLEYLRTGEMNEGYYWDAKTAKLSQKLLESPGRQTLFDMTADMPEADLQKICRFVKDYIIGDNENNTNP